MAVAAVALGAVLVVGDGDDEKPGERTPSGSPSGGPSPSFSLPTSLPSGLPSALPSGFPTALPSGMPTSLPSGFPSGLLGVPTARSVESALPMPTDDRPFYFALASGDCFDLPAGGPGGRLVKRSCFAPHDGEVVATPRLSGTYDSESALKDRAAELCRQPMRGRSLKQPVGTARGTLVQYPKLQGYRLGIRSVTCSLTAEEGGTGSGRKLTKPLA
ncbi:hypothetical protein [Streptomyces syringium]|uniref:hypothetical protein n=1 Tax=Streptomyces syringium TaxID=76729 RepID=UPI00341943FB